jgi:hypothetical protein
MPCCLKSWCRNAFDPGRKCLRPGTEMPSTRDGNAFDPGRKCRRPGTEMPSTRDGNAVDPGRKCPTTLDTSRTEREPRSSRWPAVSPEVRCSAFSPLSALQKNAKVKVAGSRRKPVTRIVDAALAVRAKYILGQTRSINDVPHHMVYAEHSPCYCCFDEHNGSVQSQTCSVTTAIRLTTKFGSVRSSPDGPSDWTSMRHTSLPHRPLVEIIHSSSMETWPAGMHGMNSGLETETRPQEELSRHRHGGF